MPHTFVRFVRLVFFNLFSVCVSVCYMQLAMPKVVAIAVSTVITMLRILPQVELLLKVPIVVI